MSNHGPQLRDRRIHRQIRQLERSSVLIVEFMAELHSPSCGMERASIVIGALAGADSHAARRALARIADSNELPHSYRIMAVRAMEQLPVRARAA